MRHQLRHWWDDPIFYPFAWLMVMVGCAIVAIGVPYVVWWIIQWLKA